MFRKKVHARDSFSSSPLGWRNASSLFFLAVFEVFYRRARARDTDIDWRKKCSQCDGRFYTGGGRYVHAKRAYIFGISGVPFGPLRRVVPSLSGPSWPPPSPLSPFFHLD